MKIANNETHEYIAETLVKSGYSFDLTSWNEEVKANKEWMKQGIIDRDLLLRCIKNQQDKLNDNTQIIIL